MEITIINDVRGKADVVAHRAGCTHIKQDLNKSTTGGVYTQEYASKREAFLDYNADFIYDDDEDDAYAIHWEPCTADLPEDEGIPAATGNDTKATRRRARTWNVDENGGEMVCQGACGERKHARAFPTTKVKGYRGVECRKCRDARLAARKG